MTSKPETKAEGIAMKFQVVPVPISFAGYLLKKFQSVIKLKRNK